jgi:hypothetical protein
MKNLGFPFEKPRISLCKTIDFLMKTIDLRMTNNLFPDAKLMISM